MKLTTSVIILALVASASAQQTPANQPATPGTQKTAPAATTTNSKTAPAKTGTQPAAKPTTAQTKAAPKTAPATAAKTAPATTKTATATKTAPAQKAAPKTAAKAVPAKAPAKAPVKPMPKTVAKKPAVKKPAAPKEAKKEGESEAPKVAANKARRDPFMTVIVDRSGPGACSGGGKQCLIADEVSLKGIVRANGGMIAVVTNKDNRAYFLRENDPVLNGVVTRITEGSITFREKTTDIFGKSVTREVVKKINPTPA